VNPAAGQPSLPNLPRWFWPLTIGLAALVAVGLLATPVATIASHSAKNYNEGWNAYRQQDAMHGIPLYGTPPRLVWTNYPPISFHLIGLASRPGGAVNQTGRWIALASLLLVALLCSVIVRRFTASTPLAAYTALSVVIWLAAYQSDRIAMNDPQLLATVFSLLGLYTYIRDPEDTACLLLSAVVFTISLFTKHNLLAFPAAVGLHLLLRAKWKGLAMWGGTAVAGSALLLGLTLWIDGPYFITHMLMPRPITRWLANVPDYLSLFLLPLGLAAIWSWRHSGRARWHVMALAAIMAHAFAVAFSGGYGVDRNVFFDGVLSLAVVGALVFAEFAPMVAQWKWRGCALTALLTASTLCVSIQMPAQLRNDRAQLRSAAGRSREFDSAVSLLRSRPGPALCGDLLLCFAAGKPLSYDPYSANNMLMVGRVKEEELTALIADRHFRTIQMRTGGLTPGERYLPPKSVKALAERYRPAMWLKESAEVVMVPRE
jgi:hypothetical protein